MADTRNIVEMELVATVSGFMHLQAAMQAAMDRALGA